MSQIHEQICPWCHTEIVWDPEIGPEKECPHCFNELGDYRTMNLTLKQTGQDVDPDDEEEYEDELDEDFNLMDEYEEAVQHIVDGQDEAPECPSCRSFMLLAGTQEGSPSFVPHEPELLKQPLLKASFAVQVYVCPSCFRIEQHLAEADRMAMMELLRQAKL